MRTFALFSIFLLGLLSAKASDNGENATLPAPIHPIEPPRPAKASSNATDSIQWAPLARQAFWFMSIQHGFRLATEPGTRTGLRGPFISGWTHAAGNLHGWADGDPFYVNYVGHPMQGAVASHLFINNDPRYRDAEFGKNALYWKSRLRATAFSFAYSTQFEIGPFSEASIGKIQSRFPQHGFVDHVVTPLGGLVWTIAEDAVDQLVIRKIEDRVENSAVRIILRGALNPSRSFANVLSGKVPWYRPYRGGIWSYGFVPEPPKQIVEETPESEKVERFSLATPMHVRRLGRDTCVGAGANAAIRLTETLDWAIDVNGCKIVNPGNWLSGEALVYQTGPRWRPASSGRWNPHVYMLAGGLKVTKNRNDERPPTHTWERNGFALSMGGGLDVSLSRAFALRLASLEYMHAWMPPVRGVPLNDGFRASVGLMLRIGTW